MASHVDDRVLWTAVIVSAVATYWYVPYFLRHVKDLAAVAAPKPVVPEPHLEQDAEAAIKSETLAKLASGPSHLLTASAIRLTASRFIKDPNAKSALLRDLSSKNPKLRDRAIDGLSLLLDNPALRESKIRQHFVDEATFLALVTALVNILPEHEQVSKSSSPPASPIRPAHRPVHERIIIYWLIGLFEERGKGRLNTYQSPAQLAVNVGIITKWLQHYPFPCTLPQYRKYNFKKHDVCTLLWKDKWGTDDLPMSKLVQHCMSLPSGARQLAEAGLRKSATLDREWARRSHPYFATSSNAAEDDEDDHETGELIEEADLLGMLDHSSSLEAPLRHPRSAGERSRQRRNRQAIVVAEAGETLRPENILQRRPTETELNWEQEIQGRQGEILRNTSRRSAGFEGSSEELGADQVARERIDGFFDDGRPFLPPLPPVDLESTAPNGNSSRSLLDDDFVPGYV